MSKKMLKMLSLLVACVLVLTVLSGCGGAKKEANPAPAPAQTQAQAPAAATNQPPVTLDWLAYQTVAEPDPNSDIAKAVEKKFNVKFNYWYVDDQKYDDMLNVKLAAGEMPDVFRVKTRGNLDKYVKQGVAGELPEETIRKLAPSYSKMADTYDTAKILWNAMKYDGKNYGFTFVTADGSYPNVLEWRTDWLKNVGIGKTPETLSEFETAMTKFRNEDPDKNGKKDTYGLSSTTFQAIFGAFGISEPKAFNANNSNCNVMVRDGKVVFSAIQPEAKEALAVLQKYYKNELIDPEFVTGENKGGYWALSHAFMNNRVGVTSGVGFYHYCPPNTCEGVNGGPCYIEMKKVNPDSTFDIGKAPTGPGGKSGTMQGGYVGESFTITTKGMKDNKKVEAILKMVDTMHSDEEYSAMVSWGIKDVDWKIDPQTKSIITVPASAAEARKKGILIFSFASISPDVRKKMQPTRYEYADRLAKFNGYINPIIPPTEAFTKNSETLRKLTDEAYISIITGTKPVDSFDEFVKKFKTNGGDETEKAMTDVYNKMIAK